jgi:hypothetical protein
MCDMSHDRDGFGFLVDAPEIRTLVDEVRRIAGTISADQDRVMALRPAVSK